MYILVPSGLKNTELGEVPVLDNLERYVLFPVDTSHAVPRPNAKISEEPLDTK